jgi:NAD(P)-dependent dehydrogenase (short-subunit alcohol dehydrogenase family)
MSTTIARQDPRTLYYQPPMPEQTQESPGSTAAMNPVPDHGEESYRGHGRLQDCAALITGGDSGIGRAVAIAFAREGADVLVSHWKENEDARATVSWVEKAGRKGVAVAGDVADEAHCVRLVDRTFEEFGRLDVLVNNASFHVPHERIEDWPSEQFERTFRVNLFSMFYLCKAALPRMAAGGAIINTASIQAYQPRGTLLDYATTKSATIGFTKALADLAIESGVRVNAVAPGPVWTPLIPASYESEKVQEFGSSKPLGRPAQPAELAPLYVLLASPEASYITGEVYGATGGSTPF